VLETFIRKKNKNHLLMRIIWIDDWLKKLMRMWRNNCWILIETGKNIRSWSSTRLKGIGILIV
jgi:hypothetical protein